MTIKRVGIRIGGTARDTAFFDNNGPRGGAAARCILTVRAARRAVAR
jgi:hypothetical protein